MDEIRTVQQAVQYALAVPYFRAKLAEVGIHQASDIQRREDFWKVPFFDKEDLRIHYPFGLFAKPLEEMVRVHASSGTTGKPVVVGYTKNDIENWQKILAEALGRMGVSNKDIVHNAFGYGLFTGGLGWHYGVEELGALVIPISTGNMYRQVLLMKDFGATVMIGTPSYGLVLLEALARHQISVDDLQLRIGIFGGEPLGAAVRDKLAVGLQIDVFDTYGLSELMGPGVASECRFHTGLHLHNNFYGEVLGDDDQILDEGGLGELVISNINCEGSPVLRYRTRDITSMHYGHCPCGFTGYSIAPIAARKDDMIIVEGINIYPSQIEEIVLEMAESTGQYRLIVKDAGGGGALVVEVEVSQPWFDDGSSHAAMVDVLAKQIRATIGITVDIALRPPGAIGGDGGKVKRVFDQRG